jgi:hypothetical protein
MLVGHEERQKSKIRVSPAGKDPSGGIGFPLGIVEQSQRRNGLGKHGFKVGGFQLQGFPHELGEGPANGREALVPILHSGAKVRQELWIGPHVRTPEAGGIVEGIVFRNVPSHVKSLL